jgi:predicted transcriptional regulator
MMYELTNIDNFSEEVRHFVFSTFIGTISKMLNISHEQTSANKDQYISFLETKNIITDIVGENTAISKSTIVEICGAVNARIFSNILSKLASEDLVECAFSDEENQFIFSVTEKGKERGIKISSSQAIN